jgi:hypothetical protein
LFSKNNVLKGAGVLLIAATLIFSTVAVTADTTTEPTITLESPTLVGDGTRPLNQPILWDNGMDYSGLCAAQMEAGGLDCRQADDFLFEEDTEVFDVHWIGGYWQTGYQNAHWPWEIIFWFDDGTGNAPGNMMATFYFDVGEYTETFIDDTGTSIYYEMSVILPDPIMFLGGEKYWITIWAYGTTMPQSGWGKHDTTIMHQAVWWSDYFGLPPWTNGEDVLGYPHDMCFQLTGEGEPAIPNLECEGELDFGEVDAGSTVEGSFKVKNIGDPESELDWEVIEWPEWGNWTFDPDSGTDLTPEDEDVTVDVEVVAPEDEETEFTGEVKVVNSEDPDDFCIIDVSLTTPVSENLAYSAIVQFLENLIQRFPLLGQILSLLPILN